jgi:hypothetical protein
MHGIAELTINNQVYNNHKSIPIGFNKFNDLNATSVKQNEETNLSVWDMKYILKNRGIFQENSTKHQIHK